MGEAARILVIDGDENMRKVLETILEDEGYIVETAEKAKKGIEVSEKAFYNLALIDVRLPDIEGIDLIKIAQHQAENAKNNSHRLPNASKCRSRRE